MAGLVSAVVVASSGAGVSARPKLGQDARLRRRCMDDGPTVAVPAADLPGFKRPVDRNVILLCPPRFVGHVPMTWQERTDKNGCLMQTRAWNTQLRRGCHRFLPGSIPAWLAWSAWEGHCTERAPGPAQPGDPQRKRRSQPGRSQVQRWRRDMERTNRWLAIGCRQSPTNRKP